MANQLVFCIDPQVKSGGFADRITGMAALHKFAKSLSIDFKIHFKTPFSFFNVFPQKKQDCEFNIELLGSRGKEVQIFNLIDENFYKEIDNLGKSLISNDDFTALVFINNIKPVLFNIFNNNFIPISYQPDEYDLLHRKVLYEFGLEFLIPTYSEFDDKFKSLLPEFESNVLGVQIRVGGVNKNWIDPVFRVPSIEEIISKIDEFKSNAEKIFICSDDLYLKNLLIEKLSINIKTLFYDNTPLHLDRSESINQNFISNALGDHCLLRLCNVGVIIGDGGYGQTAAVLSGAPYHRIISS